MKRAGVDTLETVPVSVQLETSTDIVMQVKGINVSADV